jgi:hypothetical protein
MGRQTLTRDEEGTTSRYFRGGASSVPLRFFLTCGQLERQHFAVVAFRAVVRPYEDELDAGWYSHAIDAAREGLFVFMRVQKLAPSQELAVWREHLDRVGVIASAFVDALHGDVEIKGARRAAPDLRIDDVGFAGPGAGGAGRDGKGGQGSVGFHCAATRATKTSAVG